jgi:ABC-type transport system involved in cytochrome c biogenesis permease subunit
MNKDLSKLSDAELANQINQHLATHNAATQPWSSGLVQFLTVSVLVFGILVIIIMAILVLKKSQTGEILRLFTVPMVIVAAVFLVVTGFSNEQITPVIGLLGTLAGYILGVQSQKGTTPPPP